MSDKIDFDSKYILILLYNSSTRMLEDKTSSIKVMYKAYYYNNFTGYNVYFYGTHGKFFYKLEHVKFLNFIRRIDIQNQDVIVDGKLLDVITVDLFEAGYYKVNTHTNSFLTRNIQLKSNKYRDIYSYYTELARNAGTIANEDEALYFLSKNYQRITPSRDSVLHQYLEGRFESIKELKQEIIVPFDFNQSQYQAIQSALFNSISVIEGPPGTGKTQTILNLISNILSRNMNCAVVSNNNTAIDNIYEKLYEEDFSFVAASLGRADNVGKFFENQDKDELDTFMRSNLNSVTSGTSLRISNLNNQMKKIHRMEIDLAKHRDKLDSILVEQRNHDVTTHQISINQMLNPEVYLWLKLRLEKPKKIRFFERIRINYKYKIKIQRLDHNKLIDTLETIFYRKKISELKYVIRRLEEDLKREDKLRIINELKKLSKDYLLDNVKKHYESVEIKQFTKESYKVDYSNFLKRYPVVLSTSQSLLNNAPKGFLFDYLIIDEASQGDLLSSVLAMSCAKRLVVVGDSRQLQQIDEERLFDISKELATKYGVSSAYRYEENSILKSVKKAVKDVPTTLLKEHYRCAPDIINFCNKMFYDDELIPMTKNNGIHIEIIKTVPGNHARKNPFGTGLYNQREIDELVSIFDGKKADNTGVITPFRYQANLIQNQFIKSNIEADTIHKFQGRQKDEIYLSFVVNSLDDKEDGLENRLTDFVTDQKLLNVAISRGKNKVTAIVSDKIYYSTNNIIKDFITYTENLYGNLVTKTSNISSVFDYLYKEYDEILNEKYKSKPSMHKTELLMIDLINDLLKSYTRIGYTMHVRLSKIVKDTSMLNDEEKKFVGHPWTHVDFLFYNKVTKQSLFVLEVDGIRYHEQDIKQSRHDEIKDRFLKSNGIPIYRLKTNESNEKKKLESVLNKYVY